MSALNDDIFFQKYTVEKSETSQHFTNSSMVTTIARLTVPIFSSAQIEIKRPLQLSDNSVNSLIQ